MFSANMRSQLVIFLLCAGLLYLVEDISALQYNVTIDDQAGDPTNGEQIVYTPRDAWLWGQDCSGCGLMPANKSLAYLGTWTIATYEISESTFAGQIIQASVGFKGVSVYVECIILLTDNTDDGINDMTFFIDGNASGSFFLIPTSQSTGATFAFNHTVFSSVGLPNTEHTLLIQSGNSNQKAVVLLDAVTYTVDDGDGNNSEPVTSTAQTVAQQSISVTSSQSASASVAESYSTTNLSGPPIASLGPAQNNSQGTPDHESSRRLTAGIAAGVIASFLLAVVLTSTTFVYLRKRNECMMLNKITPLMDRRVDSDYATRTQTDEEFIPRFDRMATIHKQETNHRSSIPDADDLDTNAAFCPTASIMDEAPRTRIRAERPEKRVSFINGKFIIRACRGSKDEATPAEPSSYNRLD